MSRLILLSVLLTFAESTLALAEDKVDFNRDIRPLLSDRCFQCHGPDEQKLQAGLRLDSRETATAELESGERAVVPGDLAKSAMWERINEKDPSLRMPPAETGKSLSSRDIELLGKWIKQGAEWKGHWSFIQPERPQPPSSKRQSWGHNPIDQFSLAKMEAAGLSPQSEADRTTLIRRVTFDLTGLPPTLEEVDAFLNDKTPNAYERVVDRLLKSPSYGEHMARYWLDAARYGDTHGLHLDNERAIWLYREWVINAFNQNKPFDVFTIEQIAGDLLPNPTLDQRIATGFNRCNVTTSEGGSIAEEYKVRYAIDRTETTSTVWMGLTVGCAVCHDHKFDPISQREFYQLYAYFNNTADAAMDGNALLPPPVIKVPTPMGEQRERELTKKLSELKTALNAKLATIEYQEPPADAQADARSGTGPREYVWVDDKLPAAAKPQGQEGPKSWRWVPDPVYSGSVASTRTAGGLSQHFFTDAKPGLKVGEGDVLFAYVYLDPKNLPKEIMLQFNDGNWEHRAIWGENKIEWGKHGTASRRPMGKLPAAGQWTRLEVPVGKVGLKPGSVINGMAFTQFGGTVSWDKAGIVSHTPQQGESFESLARWEAFIRSQKKPAIPGNVLAAVKLPREKRKPVQQKLVLRHFIENVYSESKQLVAEEQKQIAATEKQLNDLKNSFPSTMVMAEGAGNRETFVLTRGEYDMPDKKQKVTPNVPKVLPPLPQGAPPSRMTLAKWLVNADHPLTARVAVNRYWQRYFGVGLVKTAEDFGSQGEWPSHPRLLDWLATEFVGSGWDIKHMQKLMVMSATYRQSSCVSPELYERDPENRLLARGPRFRLDAEAIRDNALAVSGLLVDKIGGKSVKPYQPSGIWKVVGYTNSNTANFKQDDGKKLYRRSLYTFWKRTAPPPSMATFDAPSRESCTVRRPRTNTPLQALVLMNDVQFVEASRHFAERMLKEQGGAAERIRFGFRLATAREPSGDEVALLTELLSEYQAEYRADKDAAKKLLASGDSPRDESLDVSEHAAWTMLGNLILNLDETVTKG